MKPIQEIFTIKVSVAMVRAALTMMALTTVAHAAETSSDDPAVDALVKPTSSIEVGVGVTSDDSFKYGEYNGLENKGAYGIVNIDLEKRSPYDSGDTSHLRLRGNNLGLESRDVTLEYGQQGKFKLNFGYDELRRNYSDSYQTPYLGTGTSSLYLPTNWMRPVVPQNNATNLNFRGLSPVTGTGATLVGGVPTPPNAGQLATLQTIQNADLPAFQDYDLSTKRKRFNTGFTYDLNPEWSVTGSFQQEKKEGAKPLGALVNFTPVGGVGGDAVVILPEQINSTTQQFNLALNYTGEKFFGQVAYYGSLFDNDVNSTTWQDPKTTTVNAIYPSMSDSPSNQYHEISLTGGYNFTKATKLVVNGSYGRSTQDEAFVSQPAFNPAAFQTPVSSADALVVTKTLGATLTSKLTKEWNIATGFKYSDRDNQTPVNQFIFYDGDTGATGTSPFATYLGQPGLGSNSNVYNNRPHSKTVYQYKFDTDYKLTKNHTVAGGYEWEKTENSCDATWIACADADAMRENTWKAEWRAIFTEDVNTRVAYAHSRRNVGYNENAWLAEVPLANVANTNGTLAGTSVYNYLTQNNLTGYGPLLGFPAVALTPPASVLTPNNNIVSQNYYGSRNNVSEIPGMRRYNAADRTRDKVRTSVNWQATERLSLQGGFDYNQDQYDETVYGLKSARDYAVNLDSTYLIGEDFSASLFYSFENMNSNMTSTPTNVTNTNAAPANDVLVGSPCYTSIAAHNLNAKMDPCNKWSAQEHDTANTLGLALTKKNMFGGKFDATSSFLYTRARTNIDVSGGTYVANPQAANAGEPGMFFIAADNLPGVTTDILTFSTVGEYRLDKTSAFRLGYSYQHLKSSSDYYYEGLQTGSLTAVMPTNEQVATYTVHSVAVSYVYRFQ